MDSDLTRKRAIEIALEKPPGSMRTDTAERTWQAVLTIAEACNLKPILNIVKYTVRTDV